MALVEIIVLRFAISADTVMFRRIDRMTGALLLPYVLWFAYASVLNASLWLLN